MAGTVRVLDIVDAIDSVYPFSDAGDFDVVGVMLGLRSTEVEGVVCALDPTLEALDFTIETNSNVLLTHHPLWKEAPTQLDCDREYTARVIAKAAKHDIVLINAHTNLDVADAGRKLIPSMLGLIDQGPLYMGAKSKGGSVISYAQMSVTPSLCSVRELANKCKSVFGGSPKVWGDNARPVNRVVSSTGSASWPLQLALNAQADVLITGEIRYHSALHGSRMGMSIIELGHDYSEEILVPLLVDIMSEHTPLNMDQIHRFAPELNYKTI